MTILYRTLFEGSHSITKLKKTKSNKNIAIDMINFEMLFFFQNLFHYNLRALKSVLYSYDPLRTISFFGREPTFEILSEGPFWWFQQRDLNYKFSAESFVFTIKKS